MSAEPEPLSHPIVVLVAEDDALIRMMAVEPPSDAGFVVIGAAQADHALEVLTLRANSIQALFTDIQMPGRMTGMELAHHVSSHWPWIAVLVASGNFRPGLEAMPTGSRFLPKPYKSDRVVWHVREVVDAK